MNNQRSRFKNVNIPIEFHNFLNQVEENMKKNMGLPNYISDRIKLKSEIQRKIPLIFKENPNIMKQLIDINRKKKENKNVF